MVRLKSYLYSHAIKELKQRFKRKSLSPHHLNPKFWRHACLPKFIAYEPVHEFSKNVVRATSNASDQPVHMRSLIRAFASRLSILWLLSCWLNTIWSF